MVYDIPERSLDPPEDRVYAVCDHCGGEIYEGETVYRIDGAVIHEDCLMNYTKERFEDCREEDGIYAEAYC